MAKKLDIYWATGTFIPYFINDIKTVSVVYDLVHRVLPGSMSFQNYLVHRLFFHQDIQKATKIISISKSTSEKLEKYTGRKTDEIIYPSNENCKTFISEIEEHDCLERYNIQGPFLLAVATWEPRKNLDVLLDTFLKMKKEGEVAEYSLVLVGGRGWKDRKITKIAGQYSATELIRPLGYIPREDLLTLYSCCSAFVFPSVYEGFGMPVLEARSMGARVVASDIPEIREAGGLDCIYIDPSGAGIRKGILEALRRSSKQKNDDGFPSWADGTQKLARIFTELFQTNCSG